MAWYDGLFGSDSGINDQDKAKLANQGLLQAGLGILAANGRPGVTPFQAISGGLLGGLGSVQQGAADMQNQRYKNAIEQSTMANMQAAQLKAQQEAAQKKALHDALAANTDAQGNVDIAGAVRMYGKSYPEDAANALVTLHGGKPEIKDSSQGALQIFPDGYNAYLQANGMPQPAQGASAMPPSIPAPMGAPGGGSAYTPPPPLLAAQAQVESGGNPNAVSSAGALGTMQTLPSTLRDPGFGVLPARNNSPAELTRVGNDYSTALQQKYGQIGGLAAYNWGPGNWDKALAANGGNVQAALASAPAETQDYVPKVLGAAGMPQSAPSQLPAGRISLQAPSKTVSADDEKYAKLINFGVPQAAALEAAYGVKPQTVTQNQPPSYDPSQPTGDEYLKTLPPGRRAAVQSIIEGRQELPKGYSLKNPAGFQLMQDVVQADPTFDATNFGARANAAKQFTSATSPNAPANQIRSVQTIANHMSTMVNNIQRLGLGSWGFINEASNYVNSKQGASNPEKTRALGAFDQDAKSIADETAKLFAGTGSALADRDHVIAMLSRDQPVEKLQGSLGELATLVGGRLEALDNQATTALGPLAAAKLNILTPDQRQVLAGVQTMAQTGKYTGPIINTSLNKSDALASSPKPNAGWSIQQVGN